MTFFYVFLKVIFIVILSQRIFYAPDRNVWKLPTLALREKFDLLHPTRIMFLLAG